ncbi:hypothetical protein Tco_0505489 [Tanacetum coccineum]
MVAFLAKPTESNRFEQILDFLNANPIKYALTVNPTIYTSCIEQFWATAKVKIVNGEVQLQALVDGNKVIITETSVRRDLQLEDAAGIECLPNADIFEQLALMGKIYIQVGSTVSNFIGRINGMHVFVGNFTYIVDFMIVDDISSIINPTLSQVVLGKPFVVISNMTHDPPEGVVRFTNRTDEVAYKIPHMIEQDNSLSDLKTDHTKSVYLRNEEDKRRGVEYVMSKILGFYKECLELGPEYVSGMDDEGEVT